VEIFAIFYRFGISVQLYVFFDIVLSLFGGFLSTFSDFEANMLPEWSKIKNYFFLKCALNFNCATVSFVARSLFKFLQKGKITIPLYSTYVHLKSYAIVKVSWLVGKLSLSKGQYIADTAQIAKVNTNGSTNASFFASIWI
jgi:hypothetical protein